MDEVLVATPLKGTAVSGPYEFPNGISVQQIDPILWDRSIVKGFISEQDKESLSQTQFWLCAKKEVQYATSTEGDELLETVRRAMYATQIICPSGGMNIYLKFRRTREGYDNIGSSHPSILKSSLLGRVTFLERQGFVADFEKVYEGVNRAFDEKIVRLQNPILVLEHGQQIGNVPLSMLLWVIGLDMLYMAGEIQPFVDRVNGFLGGNDYIFPVTSILEQQPSPLVKDVVADLYRFRNILAHGREIPESPYRRKHAMLDVNRCAISGNDYTYAQLMQEAALFILCKSLRKIFVKSLVDEVKDDAKWKGHLKTAARVFQTTTGP